ncbi:MAG: glycosyltransferase family 4 protein [Planctomycetota bacterium]
MSDLTEYNSIDQSHVVVLINYLRKHHALTYHELAKHVGKLTILVSTPMEGDRQWQPDWMGLNVIVQKNFTFTLNRNSGFNEKNFIHVPWDTFTQLRQLRPDIVLSYEMGIRTALSVCYRAVNREVPVILVGNMSTHLETRRGFTRKVFRNLLKSTVNHFTYNGKCCKEYLGDLGIPDERMHYFPYCFDREKTYQGTKIFSESGVTQFLYCGALSERKAILPFSKILSERCKLLPHRKFKFTIAGDGMERKKLQALSTENLEIELLGDIRPEDLSELYKAADVCAYPTLGDEWGLVPIEAWASGVPVLGSKKAQSVDMHCEEDINGWGFDPSRPAEVASQIDRVLVTPRSKLEEMSRASRNSVSEISPSQSAIFASKAIELALNGTCRDSESNNSIRSAADLHPNSGPTG